MRLASWLILLAILSFPCPARAQNEVVARRHFDEGVRLLEDSRFAAAARELERSLELRDSPPVTYNLGLAYRGMGRYKKAIELFERFLKTADSERHGPMRVQVEKELTVLRAGLVELSLEVRGGASSVRVDRARVATRDGRIRLELDPGPHRVEVERRGYRSVVRELDLAPGARVELVLRANEVPLPARLVVETNPRSATVRIDGRTVARGGFDAPLSPGPHQLRVEAQDHRAFERRLVLAPGTTERVNVALEAESSGVLSSVWFWTGAAVVLVGGATAVFLLTRPDDPEPDRGSLGFVIEALR